MGPAPTSAHTAMLEGFVSAAGTALVVGDTPVRLVGVNRYDLASSPRFTCGRSYDDAELDRLCAEAAAAGAQVIRTWVFATHTDDGRDFSALDRLVATARRHDLRLILTLENEWRDCTTPDPTSPDGRKGVAWFARGWRDRFAPHLERVATRFRDEPAIAAFQLLNEAECPDADVLVRFAEAASTLLKAAAPRHLVSLGTIGGGQAGTTGDAFRRLHAPPTIDLVEVHDYGHEHEALPSHVVAALDAARALGKPCVVGEAGIAVPGRSAVARAALLEAKLEAALAHGCAAYLVWSFYDLSPAPTGWDFGPDDPLADVLRRCGTRRRFGHDG